MSSSSTSALKDGIDNVLVTLDRKDPTFTAGETMTGQVTVFCNETTAVRGVRLKILGTMNIHWREVESGNFVNYREFEDYLSEELTVWAPRPNHANEMWMMAGTHTYDWTFELPGDLPETLEDSRYAKVTYELKASVHMTGQRVSHSLEEQFYIISVPDKDKELPKEEDLPKENYAYGEIGGHCFMKKAFVELCLRLEKSVYQLGDTINLEAECRVEGGITDVNKVIAVLVQEAIYIVDPMSKEEARKKERLVMAEAVDEEDADVGEKQAYKMSLQIDDRLPLSDYPWCDFIHMGYFVHIIARTHGFYDDVVVKLPIIIQPRDHDPTEADLDKIVLEDEEEDENEEEEEKEDEEEEEADEEDGEENKGFEGEEGEDVDDLLQEEV